MSYELNVRNFVTQLANDNTWTTSNLPKWANDQLSSIPSLQSSKGDATSLRIDLDIQIIQKLILARPELLKHDLYCRNVQTVLQKLRLFRTQVFNSTQTQNSTNSNASTTDSLEGLINRVQEVWSSTQSRAEEVWAFSKLAEHREQQSYWQSIFQEQLTSHILLIVDKKDHAEVLTLLVKAIECKDSQAIKDCLKFIEENNLQKFLKGLFALNVLFNNQEVSDFSIVVANNENSNSNQNDKNRIYVNKTILSAISPYFANYFSSSWSTTGKESNSQEMNVQGSYADIYALIQYFYTGDILLTADNVFFLLEKAHYWQLSHLTKLCEIWLVDHLSPEDLFKFYQDNHFYTEGILKSAIHKLHLRSLSAENYQQIFLWAEQMQDLELQDKILQYLTIRFLASISSKLEKNSSSETDSHLLMHDMAYPSEQKEMEVQNFLKSKGHLLQNLDLEKLPFIADSTRLSILQQIVKLFPNLSRLNLTMKWLNLEASEVNELVKLKKLLALQVHKITDFRVLMSLSKLGQLQELILSHQNFSYFPKGVEEYHQEMIVSGVANQDVTASEFAKTSCLSLFSTGLPLLKKLHLSHCEGIHVILPALQHQPNFKELKFESTYVDSLSAEFIAQVSTLEKLDTSSEELWDAFWSKYIEHMAKSGQTLKELHVKSKKPRSGVLGLESVSLLEDQIFFKKFTKLEKLYCHGKQEGQDTLKIVSNNDSDISKYNELFLKKLQDEGIISKYPGSSPGVNQSFHTFFWAEKLHDLFLQELILQGNATKLLELSLENRNSAEREEIIQFLKKKGHLLKKFSLDTSQLASCSSSERLRIFHNLLSLFPNLSQLHCWTSSSTRNEFKSLTLDEFKEITHLKNLETLSLEGQNFNETGEANARESWYALFSEMPMLRKVEFSKCNHLDLALSALIDHQSLQELLFKECVLMEDSTQDLIKMTSLQKLDFFACEPKPTLQKMKNYFTNEMESNLLESILQTSDSKQQMENHYTNKIQSDFLKSILQLPYLKQLNIPVGMKRMNWPLMQSLIDLNGLSVDYRLR